MKKLLVLGLAMFLAGGCISKPAPWVPNGDVADVGMDARGRNADGKGDTAPGDSRTADEIGDTPVADVPADIVQPVDLTVPDVADVVTPPDLIDVVPDATKDVEHADVVTPPDLKDAVLDAAEELESADVVDSTDADICQPKCAGKECGDDGCGELCGECGAGECGDEGQCVAFAVKLTTQMSRIGFANTGFGVSSGSWTFEFWIQVHSEFIQGAKFFFVMNEAYATYGITAKLTEADGKTVVSFSNYIGGAGGVNGNSVPVGDGDWHHIAWVFDGAGATIFTDGVPGLKVAGNGVLKAQSSMSLGKPSGYGDYYAAPVNVGPIRFSNAARYADAFAPADSWQVDGNTIGQWLVKSAFDGITLIDEAGGNNNGLHEQGVIPTTMP